MLPYVTAAGSQKYDALLSTILPAGDANADGIVDYADFQALQANYGLGTMTYWTQGDFNDDGTVNWSDLNILRQNLDPAGFTLAQFAQQAVFGEPATVDSPTALEYDGYGVTYASSLPFASSSGTVKLNQNSAGQPIVLGGANDSEGLGVAANSSATIALNGQYSRFDSTIGVDSSGSTASSVIFEVYGDNTLLYQSPVMAYGSSPVPIDVNVAGVQKLKLVMVPAPGSTAGQRPRRLGRCPADLDRQFRRCAALCPDVASLAERPGPVHADGRFFRVRRPAGHVHDHLDRHRRTGRHGLGQHQRDGGPRCPNRRDAPQRFRDRRQLDRPLRRPGLQPRGRSDQPALLRQRVRLRRIDLDLGKTAPSTPAVSASRPASVLKPPAGTPRAASRST